MNPALVPFTVNRAYLNTIRRRTAWRRNLIAHLPGVIRFLLVHEGSRR